ncbi:MAG: 3-deoxy-D-manno-octulosonic acid transferase [Deltaproteobacteria bacterium]|nr:3-deoxy-D-manno-octulosonic acid transferase [Deltaproteobacteria bacterium]
MLFLYNILIILSLVILSPFIFYKLLTDKRYRTGLSERLGNIPDKVVADLKNPPLSLFAKGGDSEERPIWFHASSVGEVIASQRLLDAIKGRWPDKKLLVSTFTPTGNKAAKEKLKADGVIFLPLDLPWVVNRAVKKVNPSALILMETELWPNLIRKAGSMGIPVAVVNGRISDRSYGKYWFISPLLRKVFCHIRAFLMQSGGDAQRIITLGAEPSRVTVTGNIKFDINAIDKGIGFMEIWGGPVLLAGSTRSGEESPVLDVYKGLRERYPALKLVLAPRHLDRVREVEGILNEKGLKYVRRSEVSEKIESSILLLDTLGELASFYKYGTIVFVGGTLVPVGGHNILEPASYGRPVLFGPHIENFRDSARILEESGGGVRVNNAEELKSRIDRLLADDDLCGMTGDRAKQAVLQNRGATEMTIDGILKIF